MRYGKEQKASILFHAGKKAEAMEPKKGKSHDGQGYRSVTARNAEVYA